jgi:hypothetical protein
MKACAVLDMHSAVDTAREAYDKAEMDRKQKEIEANTRKR